MSSLLRPLGARPYGCPDRSSALPDPLIAATAHVHSVPLVTRNARNVPMLDDLLPYQ
jgi:predicted nucleic acid-binding protein